MLRQSSRDKLDNYQMFYDARNQLIDFNGLATFTYDQDGRRISATANAVTTNYLWDEFSQYSDVILETSGTNVLSYTLANGAVLSQTNNGITNYLLLDAQNSTRAVTNAAGNITSNYDYDAFGNLQGTPSLETNYLYTGQQYDAISELYSLRARYYDPSYGRFLSRDTWAYDYQNPVELNRYVYAANNPATWSDPSGYLFIETGGLQAQSQQLAAIVAVGGIAIAGSVLVPVIYMNCFAVGNTCNFDFLYGLYALAQKIGHGEIEEDIIDFAEGLLLNMSVRDKIKPFNPSKTDTKTDTATDTATEEQQKEIHIALGLNTEGRDGPKLLIPFAKNLTNEERLVIPWQSWSDYDISTYTEAQLGSASTEEFAEMVIDILGNHAFEEIHVNLEGLSVFGSYNRNNLEEFIDDYAHPTGTAFAYELEYIEEGELCDITTFYEDGSTSPRPVKTDLCG